MANETKHAPEPWRVGDWSIRDAEGKRIASIRAREREDFRRVVAAVNACAGLSTEALEAGHLAKALRCLQAWADVHPEQVSDSTISALEALGMLWPSTREALRALGRLP